jgi:hypothetical protein
MNRFYGAFFGGGVILLAIACSGCSAFTLRTARVDALEEGVSIAVAVESNDRYSSDREPLEGFFTAALISRGFKVRPIRLDHYVGPQLLEELFPNGHYSLIEGLTRGMAQSGSIEGTTEEIGEMLDLTELDDANSRLEGLVELARAMPSTWAVQYLLVAHRFDRYGFAVYVVDLQNGHVSHIVVIAANQRGFRIVLGRNQAGRSADRRFTTVNRPDLIRLAEFVVQGL